MGDGLSSGPWRGGMASVAVLGVGDGLGSSPWRGGMASVAVLGWGDGLKLHCSFRDYMVPVGL